VPRTQSDPDVEAIMKDQLAFERPEETVSLPAWRPASKKHYFRTDPGNRAYMHRIPSPAPSYVQDIGREDGKEPVKAFNQLRYESKYTAEQRAQHAAVIEANGGDRYIRFKTIPNRFEAYLETDSDVIADYLDMLIATGEIKHVYRDARIPAGAGPQVPPHRAVAALRLAQAQEAEATP